MNARNDAAIAATLVTLAIFCGSAFVISTVQEEFQSIVDELPNSSGIRNFCAHCSA